MPTEPVMFLDATRSTADAMSDGMAGVPADFTSRWQTLLPAAKMIATRAFEMDSAADEDQEIDPETGLPAGGTLFYIISGETANALGDVNPHNWDLKTRNLRPRGGTYIMPQIRQWEHDRDSEFVEKDKEAEGMRTYCLIVATDGALDNDPPRRGGPSDRQAFERWLTDPKGGARDDILVVIILVGNGPDTREALPDYRAIATSYPNKVKLVSAAGFTSEQIASAAIGFFK